MELALGFLILHGLVGGFDVFYNHEWVEHLPSRPAARVELALHAGREALFAALFVSLAWWQWLGSLAWLIVLLLTAELAITSTDVLLENKTRHLTQVEQASHLFLLLNYGVWLSLLAMQLMDWLVFPTELARVDYGWQSRMLTVLAAVAFAWSVRDGISAATLIRLHRRQQQRAQHP